MLSPFFVNKMNCFSKKIHSSAITTGILVAPVVKIYNENE